MILDWEEEVMTLVLWWWLCRVAWVTKGPGGRWWGSQERGIGMRCGGMPKAKCALLWNLAQKNRKDFAPSSHPLSCPVSFIQPIAGCWPGFQPLKLFVCSILWVKCSHIWRRDKCGKSPLPGGGRDNQTLVEEMLDQGLEGWVGALQQD